MTDTEIEEGLKKLGHATEPAESMVSGVMERVERLAIPGKDPVDAQQTAGRLILRAAAVLIAAACIAVLFLILRSVPQPRPQIRIVVRPDTQSADEPDDSIPRLVDYQRAYSQSPDALETLLQQRPRGQVGGTEPVMRTGDLFREDLNLYP